MSAVKDRLGRASSVAQRLVEDDVMHDHVIAAAARLRDVAGERRADGVHAAEHAVDQAGKAAEQVVDQAGKMAEQAVDHAGATGRRLLRRLRLLLAGVKFAAPKLRRRRARKAAHKAGAASPSVTTAPVTATITAPAKPAPKPVAAATGRKRVGGLGSLLLLALGGVLLASALRAPDRSF